MSRTSLLFPDSVPGGVLWNFQVTYSICPLSLWQRWVPRNVRGGKVRPARRADSCAVLVVPNVQVRMETQHYIPTPRSPESSWRGDETALTFPLVQSLDQPSGVTVPCDFWGWQVFTWTLVGQNYKIGCFHCGVTKDAGLFGVWHVIMQVFDVVWRARNAIIVEDQPVQEELPGRWRWRPCDPFQTSGGTHERHAVTSQNTWLFGTEQQWTGLVNIWSWDRNIVVGAVPRDLHVDIVR